MIKKKKSTFFPPIFCRKKMYFVTPTLFQLQTTWNHKLSGFCIFFNCSTPIIIVIFYVFRHYITVFRYKQSHLYLLAIWTRPKSHNFKISKLFCKKKIILLIKWFTNKSKNRPNMLLLFFWKNKTSSTNFFLDESLDFKTVFFSLF